MSPQPIESTIPFRIILASASPRRREMLEAAGLDCTIQISGVDESGIKSTAPIDHAQQAARLKADAVYGEIRSDGDEPFIVIAADTIVVLDDRQLGKPRDRADAIEMLNALSGKTHTVISALSLRNHEGELWQETTATDVTFKDLDPKAIESYVASGDADDKAGSYGVQEVGKLFIAAIDGELSNVIGLPLASLQKGILALTHSDPLADIDIRDTIIRAYPGLQHLPASFFSMGS